MDYYRGSYTEGEQGRRTEGAKRYKDRSGHIPISHCGH
jgi:hypothetical protein